MENSASAVQQRPSAEVDVLHFVSFELNRKRCVFGPFLSLEEARHRCQFYRGERNLADNFCIISSHFQRLWLVSEERGSGGACYHGPFVRQLDAVQFRTALDGASRIHEIFRDGDSVLMDGLPARLPDPPCLRGKMPAAGIMAN
ncbi:MAG: hypothetical protein EOP86_04925 [Verrucomicrobiaceae bacterium]|nr:MAG: hypothetical protein EOP86_04925 [Verrucomicrobiaceae bacterium]